MCLLESYKKKMWKNVFLASLKSMKKEVGSGVGPGSAPKCHGSPTLLRRIDNPKSGVYIVLCLHTVIRILSFQAGGPDTVLDPPTSLLEQCKEKGKNARHDIIRRVLILISDFPLALTNKWHRQYTGRACPVMSGFGSFWVVGSESNIKNKWDKI